MNIDHLQQESLIAPERISELEARWSNSLNYVKGALYPRHTDRGLPSDILADESQRLFNRDPESQLLIGIAGPGAAGKGTIGRYLADELGYAKVVNTTTRDKREGEREGIDYFFMDRSQFTTEQNLGHFALCLERLGRGWYGVSHDEITRKLAGATEGCIVEENPANIMQLFDNIKNPNIQAVLLYILPKEPVVVNSLERLNHRLSSESDPAKRIITPEVFESTLGDRQIDEFVTLVNLPKHPSITPLFIVNDNLDETKEQLTTLLGRNYATSRY